VLGLKGLILGPVLMTMAIAILRIYRDEERVRSRRNQAVESRGAMKPGAGGG
jgi:predicted PurR-regulated permease PerM